MTRLHITIDVDGAAFSDGGSEVSRVLRRLAGRIDTYGTEYVAGKMLTTTAGDECGSVRLSPDGEGGGVRRALADLAATPEDDDYEPDDIADLIVAAEKLADLVDGTVS